MAYDLQDTIVAIASAPGGAARGVVRVSGPETSACLGACFVSSDASPLEGDAARRLEGFFRVTDAHAGRCVNVPGALWFWPGARSYTRQPAAEFHTLGSPPLLAAVVDELCRCGGRPAAPGEFTLRAFLAGRIDLTQAEGVLGVVDSRSRDDLDGALDQVAGGLSRPLHALREQLLSVLAELEAGLDFADEPLEFIAGAELDRRLGEGERIVATTLVQLRHRDRAVDVPRVVLCGPPNVGKSSLFNALVEQFGESSSMPAIVSPTPGATRDYVSARLDLDGVVCELVDAAGDDEEPGAVIERAAQQAAATQRRRAELRLRCVDGNASPALEACPAADWIIATKCDLHQRREVPSADAALAVSSLTGAGLTALAGAIRRRLSDAAPSGSGAAATAARCAGSLQEAARALAAGRALAGTGRDELLAAEVRAALDALGDVVGAVCADDVLDRVFSQFCIGK